MGWKQYALAMLLFNLLGMLALYLLQRTQGWLPLNPEGLAGVPPHLAFNTAASFASNTNWQSYGGDTTLSYLTQMLGLTVQNFVSAATGMACLVALIRGIVRRTAPSSASPFPRAGRRRSRRSVNRPATDRIATRARTRERTARPPSRPPAARPAC